MLLNLAYRIDYYRYECALILNKSRQMFVLPVFVGEELQPGKFEKFSTSTAGPFPDAPHNRGIDASRVIRTLGYVYYLLYSNVNIL